MPREEKTEWATIGKVVAFFGIRGELKVFSLSDIPDRFARLEKIYVGPDHKPYTIEKVRPYKGDMIVLKLSGIEDANAAETLRNHDLCIPLDELAQLPPDSYYQHDILGLHVALLDGRELGTISEIMPTGGNDVYVVKSEQGQQFLIPAIKEVIKQIDLIRHMMYIDPMRGLLDDDAVLDSQDGQSKEEV
ncbi:16S rRNA processing protein RimM [Ktedonosporobacter rubrisoli]|uniref:Ribosome maturation factor RimM n=1 Tax=Ktedonosporobacter rubrisoli TaxID=2509675 RepID=A0A4P6K3H9_KTERU|nr:ribosome maturation factor RimM [Ktedonosporobacter rubrisoli]QBD82320.1 16S rRNA processing protein RimM [Ktedonosporobacter rubrisoli]